MTEAIERVSRRGDDCAWRGWDPYDAPNSPVAPALTLGIHLGRRALTQAVKRSPLNLRPLLRIEAGRNAKAIGLVASGYARLSAARADETATGEARRWLQWLVDTSTAPVGLGWGYHFDVETRFFRYAAGTPNVIATSFVAHAFLDGGELLGEPQWGEAAERTCEFLVERLLRDDGESAYFRYVEGEDDLVHNANALAASVLARTALLQDRSDLVPIVRHALEPTLAAQRADGSWPYAEGRGRDWVDNFHTGYVLESLEICRHVVPEVKESLERGLDYWEQNLFLTDGRPKYYANRALPEDSHNYAQAIDTWLSVASWRPLALLRAERMAYLFVERMFLPEGYFAFQRTRFWTNRVPYMRWSNAPAFKALAGLELARAWQGRGA